MELAKSYQIKYRCLNDFFRRPSIKLAEEFILDRYHSKTQGNANLANKKIIEFQSYLNALDNDTAEIGLVQKGNHITVVATIVLMTDLGLSASMDSCIKQAGFQYSFLKDQRFLFADSDYNERESGVFQTMKKNTYVITEFNETSDVCNLLRTAKAMVTLCNDTQKILIGEKQDYVTEIRNMIRL